MRLINNNESPYSIFDNMIHLDLVDKSSSVPDRMCEVRATIILDYLKNKYITTYVVFNEWTRSIGTTDDIENLDTYLILDIHEDIYDEWLVNNIVKILDIYMNQQEVMLDWVKWEITSRYLHQNLLKFYKELCYFHELYNDFTYWIMMLLQEFSKVSKPFDSYIIYSEKYDLNKNSNLINYDIEEIVVRKNDFKVHMWLPNQTIFISKKKIDDYENDQELKEKIQTYVNEKYNYEHYEYDWINTWTLNFIVYDENKSPWDQNYWKEILTMKFNVDKIKLSKTSIVDFFEITIHDQIQLLVNEWWENRNTNLEKANKILLQKIENVMNQYIIKNDKE